jgi:hypothetical protein
MAIRSPFTQDAQAGINFLKHDIACFAAESGSGLGSISTHCSGLANTFFDSPEDYESRWQGIV